MTSPATRSMPSWPHSWMRKATGQWSVTPLTIAPQSLAGLSLAEKRGAAGASCSRRSPSNPPRSSRSPTASAGCGSSTRWTRGVRRTTSAIRRGSARRSTWRRFAGALQKLVDRHPSLRTTFEERDGVLLQRVHEKPPLPLEVIDASSWSEETLRQRLEEEAHRPFDLERGPLVRMHLFRVAPDDHIFLLGVHHIVGDFWSLVLVIEEMQALYPAECDGRPAALPAPARQYSRLRPLAGRAAGRPGGRAALGVLGSSSSPARRRCSTCRPTGRGRPSSRGAAGPSPGGSSRTWCAGSRRWRRARAPRSTRCCWPRSRCCSAGTPARRISWSAPRSPAGADPDSRT